MNKFTIGTKEDYGLVKSVTLINGFILKGKVKNES